MNRLKRTSISAMAAVLLGVILLGACGPMPGHRMSHMGGDDTRGQAATVFEGDATVEIAGNAFRPGNIQVPAGASVTWVNRDGVIHTATADNGDWDTGLLDQGGSATLTFETPGVYEYRCLPHPDMRARIEVIA